MLDSLPCLVPLRCKGTCFSSADLLAVACHSTLSELHIDTGDANASERVTREEMESEVVSLLD